MRKSLHFFVSIVLLVSLVGLSSCKKENQNGVTFTATMEDCADVHNAKTVLNGTALEWVAGDEIKIHSTSVAVFTATPLNPATEATFTTTDASFNDGGSYIAFYPAANNSTYDRITLPATQVSEDGSLRGFPMYAWADGTTNLQFRNLCGVLKLNLQKTGMTVASIALTVNSPINGDYTLQSQFTNEATLATSPSSGTGSNTTTLVCNQSINTPHDFYIYLPEGTYSGLTLVITTTDGRVCTKGPATGSVVIERSKYSTLTLGGNDLMFETPGMLPGLFTINANGDQVSFAQGNLQYQSSTNTWRFADNQYDYIGADNVNISATYTGWIDLFGWGTGSNPTATTSGYPYRDYITFVDWGNNAIVNGGNVANSAWRTLTEDEWYYIVRGRNDNRNKRGTGTVNGVHGAILLPDNFTLPTSCPEFVRVSSGNNWPNNYTLAQWADMEAAGALFLPAAGNRSLNQGIITINRVNTAGAYWTSTPNPNNSEISVQSYYVKIEGSSLSASSITDSEFGYAVRLARDNN